LLSNTYKSVDPENLKHQVHLCIVDLDKLNLILWINFASAASKNTSHFKSGQYVMTRK